MQSKIPFSVEYFNAHPDCKVVNGEGASVKILHTTRLNAHYPVVGLVNNDFVSMFTYHGIHTQGIKSRNDLFILTEPKWRAWTPEEVPVGALIKCKNVVHDDLFLIVGRSCNGSDAIIYLGGHYDGKISASRAFSGFEHSTDGGKTFQPCGVQE